ncbi:MAG: TRAP transporter TAXI family solute receptor [Alphaproteobacteria bacterium]|jgi:TRAP transporter TAXI family solute receptor
MKRLTKCLLISVPFVLAANIATGADTFVRMVSGPSGGSWYPYGAKMMAMADKQMKGVSTSNGPGGGVGNARSVGKGKAEFGWTFANTAYDAHSGIGAFKKKHPNLRFFANLFPGVLQTAVPANSKIKSYNDLANKRLSPGKTTFGGNVAFEKLIGLYGITYAGVKKAGGNIHRVGYKDSVSLMKDGHIDAFVGMTTAPNSSFIALDFSPGIRFLSTSNKIAANFVKMNPGFVQTTMKAGTYKGLKADVPTIAAPTVLVTHKGVSNDIAYRMAKVVWDNHGELVKLNKFWASVKLSDALEGSAIPVHPGAMRFYKEKGISK